MNKLNVLIVAAAIALVGCSDPKEATKDPEPVEIAPSEAVEVPAFTVVERTASPPHKVSFDIRLADKISEQELAVIANHLKAQETASFDRIFILYYLPEMEIGSGAWASTHFNPSLRVKIFESPQPEATSAKVVKDATIRKADAASDQIGVWVDERPYVGSTRTLYRDGGQTKLKISFKDGSGTTTTLVESADSRGRKFVDKAGNDFGEYYILSPKGELSVYDNEGLIARMQKKN